MRRFMHEWVQNLVPIITVGVAVLFFVGCGEREGGAVGADRPTIVTTIWPLADLTEQIVGDRAEVVCLVPPGLSPHGFEPTGRDAGALSDARMLVMVGMGFDRWARESLERHGRGEASVLTFAGAVGLERPEEGDHEDHSDGEVADEHEDHDEDADSHEEDDGHDDHEGHSHGAAASNPHLWLDPVLTERFVGELGERLASILPEDRGEIERRTEALRVEIAALDEEYQDALRELEGRKIITFHNAFDRMMERYGLEVAATLTPIESPGALTSSRVERALEVIEEHGVRAVFAEPQFPDSAGRALQADSGVEVLTLDPIGDPNQSDRDTYQKMMRYNLRTLLEGLGDAE